MKEKSIQLGSTKKILREMQNNEMFTTMMIPGGPKLLMLLHGGQEADDHPSYCIKLWTL